MKEVDVIEISKEDLEVKVEGYFSLGYEVRVEPLGSSLYKVGIINTEEKGSRGFRMKGDYNKIDVLRIERDELVEKIKQIHTLGYLVTLEQNTTIQMLMKEGVRVGYEVGIVKYKERIKS